MTPLKERNIAARRALKAKGKPKLTEEMLAKIGEVIARRKGIAFPEADTTPQVAA